MRHRLMSFLVVGSLVAALPVAAEVFTIRLSNGTTFESRYQPKQAAWDPTFVTFVNEAGNEIALPQSLVAEVAAQSETKGYGRVIDTTTVDLGYMPNDLDQSQRLMQQQAQMNPQGQLVLTPGGGQFVEPGELGGGIPIGFTATSTVNSPQFNPAGGFVPTPQGGTPAPFTTPTNTGTPAPFTTPSPTVAAPTTAPSQQ
jgi:hypothetical protein